jgi:thioredoxin:protein disulfide reductase
MHVWRCLRYRLALIVLALSGLGSALAEDFLPPELAFAFSYQQQADGALTLHWDIAPGYHLYRDRLNFKADEPSAQWAATRMPPATDLFDPNFNKTMAVYTAPIEVPMGVSQGSSQGLTVGWQGCADGGLCYPPASATVKLAKPVAANAAPELKPREASANPSGSEAPADAQPTDEIASTLASGSLLHTMGVFLIAGLLLAFTPCVLPMVPILSSLIAGQSGHVSRSKGFALSLAYSVGMAIVYAAFGAAAGLAGEGLAAALQNPWVLGGFALMLSAMAMSMFGFYELQMPSFIQTRATEVSNRFKGGSYLGVFLMGGISALVVGPCVAAPLAGALVYISQTRDVVLGSAALFAMAMGMSVPLLLVGISAGSLLPRAGTWMNSVKKVFGMMLLGVAIWMVSPVLPTIVHMLLWAAWFLTAAALLGMFSPAHSPAHSKHVFARTLGAGLTALSLVLLVGAASGGESVLQPLAHLKGSGASAQASNRGSTEKLAFIKVASVAQLDTQLAEAQQKGQTVMLDFYADWCVACKELETFTFSKPQVQSRLAPARLLQADVTANSDADKALLKRFGLFGPPGMVFFDGKNASRVKHKVIGFQNADDFMRSLDRALP